MKRSLNFQPTSIQRLMRFNVCRISSFISYFAGQADFNLYHLNLLWDSLDKWDTWSNNIFTMDFNKVFYLDSGCLTYRQYRFLLPSARRL